MRKRLLGIGSALALGIAATIAIGLAGPGADHSAASPSPSGKDPASVSVVASSVSVAESGPRRDVVGPRPAPPGQLTIGVGDVVRARDTLERGRQGALAELRRVAESNSESLQQSAAVLALQAKLLKYEHSLVRLAEGGYRLSPSGQPVQRRAGHEYLIMHSFVRSEAGAHDLVFDFDLAADRFADLRVTIEDLRIVERRAEIEVAHRFNSRSEVERRAALEKHASAVLGHAELMQSIANLAPHEHQQRELLSNEAAALSRQMLPWHFIVTPGSTTVRSRLDSRP